MNYTKVKIEIQSGDTFNDIQKKYNLGRNTIRAIARG